MMEEGHEGLKHYAAQITKLEEAYQQLQGQFFRLKNDLQTSYETFHHLVNYISEGLIFVAKEGFITLFNPAAAFLTRLPQQAILQGHYWDHFSDHFFGFSMRDALLVMRGHRRVFLTLYQEIDIEVSTSAVPGRGIVLILSNRSEQQKLQKSLDQEERLKELGEMAAVLAHEIRNPLGGIEGFARLLKRDLAQPKQQEMVQAILEGTKTLNHLVNGVLDYARPMQLHFEQIELVSFMQEVISWMEKSEQGPSYTFNTALSSYQIFADKEQIKLVLLNILRNAHEAGAHHILIQLNHEGQICIKDDGCGMSEQVREKIFTPFFTTKARGCGLGLAHSLAVVKAHGGSLNVLSEKDRGTEFKIELAHAH